MLKKKQGGDPDMRKDFGAKTWMYPLPVLMIGTYNADGTPDVMNAAWGGISEEAEISICVDDAHLTADNFQARGAFTVSIATADYVTECDYLGVVSGRDVPDKVARAGFHTVKSAFVDAPIVEELPLTLECEVINYDVPTCRLVGRIVNVSADEKILGSDGLVDPALLRPITYDPVHRRYLTLGEKAGNAFSDGLKLK